MGGASQLEKKGGGNMAYVRGAASSIDSSTTFIPSNLNVLQPISGSGKAISEGEPMFNVIHKHFAILGQLGSSPGNHKLVSYGNLEEKNPSSYLTQASAKQ